jgi:phage shock protein A
VRQLTNSGEEHLAATAIQSTYRGTRARAKTSVTRAVQGNAKLEDKVAAMQEEIDALKATVNALRGDLTYQKGTPAQKAAAPIFAAPSTPRSLNFL